MRKTILTIISLIFAVVCTLGFAACSEFGDSTGNATPTLTPQPQPEATVPDIPSGDYMTVTGVNIIVHVDKENGKAAMISWEDYDSYVKTGTTGDLVNNNDVWAYSSSQVYVKFTSSIDAYKFQFGFPSAYYYVYNDGYKIRLSKDLSDGSMDTKNLVLLTDTIKAEWTKPADGTYVSKAAFKDAKYLYAVVENSSTEEDDFSKITLYMNESNSISDFSSLTPTAVIDDVLYSFIPHQLVFENDDWIILNNPNGLKIKTKDGTNSADMNKKA